jgi:hypothetical protein
MGAALCRAAGGVRDDADCTAGPGERGLANGASPQPAAAAQGPGGERL